MEPALRPAEIVLGLLPVVLLIAAPLRAFVPARPVHGFTDSGRKYRQLDTPTHVHPLATRIFWFVFSMCAVAAMGWVLFDAIDSALRSGTVSLPGQRGRGRPVVQWTAAWAYFLGLGIMLVAVLAPWLARPGSVAKDLARFAAGPLWLLGLSAMMLSSLLPARSA